MTAELAKVINDGLYFYEQDLWDQENKVEYSLDDSVAAVCIVAGLFVLHHVSVPAGFK